MERLSPFRDLLFTRKGRGSRWGGNMRNERGERKSEGRFLAMVEGGVGIKRI